MQRGSRIKENKAFTIVEVALAAAVMAMVLGSSLIVMGRGFKVLDSSRAMTYASQLMQSEMEKMRLLPWGNGSTAGAGTGTGTAYGVTNYAATLTDITSTINSSFFTAGDYASRMTITRIAEDVHTGMIRVTLTATWKTTDQRTMTQSYVTYYGKNGLYDFLIL